MKATTIWLDEAQLEPLKPLVEELNAAADNGKPGMLMAQVFSTKMKVFVLDHQRALAFAELLGIAAIPPEQSK